MRPPAGLFILERSVCAKRCVMEWYKRIGMHVQHFGRLVNKVGRKRTELRAGQDVANNKNVSGDNWV